MTAIAIAYANEKDVLAALADVKGAVKNARSMVSDLVISAIASFYTTNNTAVLENVLEGVREVAPTDYQNVCDFMARFTPIKLERDTDASKKEVDDKKLRKARVIYKMVDRAAAMKAEKDVAKREEVKTEFTDLYVARKQDWNDWIDGGQVTFTIKEMVAGEAKYKDIRVDIADMWDWVEVNKTEASKKPDAGKPVVLKTFAPRAKTFAKDIAKAVDSADAANANPIHVNKMLAALFTEIKGEADAVEDNVRFEVTGAELRQLKSQLENLFKVTDK